MIQLVLKGGAKVWCDFEIDKGRCKACRKQVFWATICNAKKMPICQDKDGNWISHFFDCPKAALFRKKQLYIPRTNGVETDEKKVPKI